MNGVPPPLSEQRDRIYTLLTGLLPFTIEKYQRDDPIPPTAMILSPRIAFPGTSQIGVTEWSIRLYEVRKALSSTAESFDMLLPPILLELGKGMQMGYVLDRVDNNIINESGYPLPGYVIVGTVPYANC